jgi:NAD(P)-dependent dehydrogenase (short-subunit alcohol dehydrogenase family)
MPKTILLTGATDGIGLETAKRLNAQGHRVLLHGRNAAKLEAVRQALADPDATETYLADLSDRKEVVALARAITQRHDALDVLINNAGVFRSEASCTAEGVDLRFAVNTLAPYLLTRQLLPLLGPQARVINLSSAAQAPVDLDALAGRTRIADQFESYAQSKLALTMWTVAMAQSLADSGPLLVAVNPGSLLATKMVKEGFGMSGKSLDTGADILLRAALADAFATASGRYFDNDSGQFAAPHADARDLHKCQEVVRVVEAMLEKYR